MRGWGVVFAFDSLRRLTSERPCIFRAVPKPGQHPFAPLSEQNRATHQEASGNKTPLCPSQGAQHAAGAGSGGNAEEGL